MTNSTASYPTRQVGALHSQEFRMYTEKDGKVISPFHDIPLYANPEKTILNMVVEIPRWTNAKLEISKDIPFNPIKQDVKKGKLRFVRNCFPHHDGAFPQTWEDPTHAHPDTGAVGDNDPLDVIEIGEQVASIGQVKQVKVLGVMALLDEGETDWKVIVIDVQDALASKLNDIEDVEKFLPGLLRATNEWFRIYKIPDGKPENVFAFNGEAKNKAYAQAVIEETHEAWKQLITGKIPNKSEKYDIQTPYRCKDESGYKVVPAANLLPAQPVDKSAGWFGRVIWTHKESGRVVAKAWKRKRWFQRGYWLIDLLSKEKEHPWFQWMMASSWAAFLHERSRSNGINRISRFD